MSDLRVKGPSRGRGHELGIGGPPAKTPRGVTYLVVTIRRLY